MVYGVVGLKTHCKTALVVRHDDDGLRCYAHIGTGNYHVKTARLYTDLGLFTCDPALTADVVEPVPLPDRPFARSAITASCWWPRSTCATASWLIDAEIAHRQAGPAGAIIAKMNQLRRPGHLEALVTASQAGVASTDRARLLLPAARACRA